MSKILHRKQLSEMVFRLTVEAPEIAAKHKAGQFIILRISEKGERIPLTIADSDAEKGTINLIVQAVGKTTRMLSELREGDEILDLLGPLGVPTHIANVKHAVMIGGGVGGAPLYPICKAYKKAGCRITVILGARNESLLVLEKEFTEIADRIIIATDRLSAFDVAVCCSHVNSYPSAGRSDKCPFELLGDLLPKGVLDELGLARISPDDVTLAPSLMAHAVVQ